MTILLHSNDPFAKRKDQEFCEVEFILFLLENQLQKSVFPRCYLAVREVFEIIICEGGRSKDGNTAPQSDKQEDGKLRVVHS